MSVRWLLPDRAFDLNLNETLWRLALVYGELAQKAFDVISLHPVQLMIGSVYGRQLFRVRSSASFDHFYYCFVDSPFCTCPAYQKILNGPLSTTELCCKHLLACQLASEAGLLDECTVPDNRIEQLIRTVYRTVLE